MATKKLRSVDDSAASVKKPRFSLPDPEEMMKSSSHSRSLLKSMTRCCKDFASVDFISLSRSQLEQFKPATVVAWLVAKYGLSTVSSQKDCWRSNNLKRVFAGA